MILSRCCGVPVFLPEEMVKKKVKIGLFFCSKCKNPCDTVFSLDNEEDLDKIKDDDE